MRKYDKNPESICKFSRYYITATNFIHLFQEIPQNELGTIDDKHSFWIFRVNN